MAPQLACMTHSRDPSTFPLADRILGTLRHGAEEVLDARFR